MDNLQAAAPVPHAVDADTPLDPQLRGAHEAIQNGYRRFREQKRGLLQNRPQSWRHLLNVFSAMRFTILFGRFIAHLTFHGLQLTELNLLSGAASVLAIATRLTWHALFANPYTFLAIDVPACTTDKQYNWCHC